MVLYNLLSAFKRLGLPEALQRIRPKRLRFLVLNTLARLICLARERVLRFASGFARSVLDRFRVRIHAPRRRSPPEADPLRRPTPQPGRPGLRTTAHGPPAPPARPSTPSPDPRRPQGRIDAPQSANQETPPPKATKDNRPKPCSGKENVPHHRLNPLTT